MIGLYLSELESSFESRDREDGVQKGVATLSQGRRSPSRRVFETTVARNTERYC